MTTPSASVAQCICGDPQCDIPYAYCHCRCGQKTSIARQSETAYGLVKGKPKRFIVGHVVRLRRMAAVDAAPFKLNGHYCRLIPLSRNAHTIVWESDYEWLMQWKWSARPDRSGKLRPYRVEILPGGQKKNIEMPRLIMDAPPGVKVDHISMDTLNNARDNLRLADSSQNAANRGKTATNRTGYKGVSRRGAHFVAEIRVRGKRIYLGRFPSAEPAAAAYREAAMAYFGEFSRVE